MTNELNRTLARTDADRSPERLVAEVLLNRRRRYVLYYVVERSDPVPVADVALQVAAWEHAGTVDESMPDELPTTYGETTPDEVTAAHGESIYSSIRRSHLPYLEAQGFVTYDSDRVTGKLDDPTVELYVANEPRTRVAWHKVYLALTAVSTLLLGLAQAGVPPFGELRPLATAALIVALFAVASVGYWYDVYRWRRRNEEGPPDFLVSVDEELPYEEEENDCNEGKDVE